MKALYLGLVLACVALTPSLDAAKPTTRLQIVVKDPAGDPVSRASVIVRTVKGKKKRKITDTLQLKTSEKGDGPGAAAKAAPGAETHMVGS